MESDSKSTVISSSLMQSSQTDTTTSNDQSRISHTVMVTVATSTESSTSHQITSQSNDPTLSVDDTTITSFLQSTDVQYESSSADYSITTVDSVTSPLVDPRRNTALSSTAQTSTNLDYSLNTSEDQAISTTDNLNEQTKSSIISLGNSRMSTEIVVSTTQTSQTISQINIDLSSNAVSPLIAVEDTTKQRSTIDSSTLEKSTIDTTNSDSSQNNLITTSEMMPEVSSSITSTVDSTMSFVTDLSSSPIGSVLSTESHSISTSYTTSTNPFTTTDIGSNSIENLLKTSTVNASMASLTSPVFQSTIASSTLSSSDALLSTFILMNTTQIAVDAQSSELTNITQQKSTGTTSIIPVNSTDNLTLVSSENEAFTETTVVNMMNSISSSISEQYSNDHTLTSSLSSEDTDGQFASTISSRTTDTTEQISTDISKSSDNQLTLSNLLSAQTTLTIDSKTTSTIINAVSSNDHTSTSLSSLLSNGIIATTNSKETGKYIMIHLVIKDIPILLLYLDKLTQYATPLSSSSDPDSPQDIISTKSSALTLSTVDSTILINEQNVHSTETIPNNLDKSISSIQSTSILHNQTSTIETIQTENNPSTIISSTEILNITSLSP